METNDNNENNSNTNDGISGNTVDPSENTVEQSENTVEPQMPDSLINLLRIRNLMPMPPQNVSMFNRQQTALEMAMRASLRDKQRYKYVLSDEGKSELKHLTFSSTYGYNETCPITQEKFEDGEKIIGLPCNHYFQSEAILSWLENTKAICPVCRFELKLSLIHI